MMEQICRSARHYADVVAWRDSHYLWLVVRNVEGLNQISVCAFPHNTKFDTDCGLINAKSQLCRRIPCKNQCYEEMEDFYKDPDHAITMVLL